MFGKTAAPARQHFEVSHTRPGRHDHPGPQDLGAPAQVEVLPHGEDLGVEPLELGEQVEAHQRASTGCKEDVAHGVVLAVVDLSGLHPVDDGATFVHRHAHVQKPRGVVPADQLRSHDAGVGPERLLDQDVDGVGVGGDVVVTQQQERCALHHRQGLVGAGPEAHVALGSRRTKAPGNTAATRGVGSTVLAASRMRIESSG